jgi:putative flippase GtrA
VRTALADLRGVVRLLLAPAAAWFVVIGVASTAAYAALFLALRGVLGAGGANAAALALTAVANTQANRRLTFGVRGRRGLLRQHAGGAAVFVLALALTAGALDALRGIDPHPPRLLELAVLVVASAIGTLSRYVALSTLFGHELASRARGRAGVRRVGRLWQRARPGHAARAAPARSLERVRPRGDAA